MTKEDQILAELRELRTLVENYSTIKNGDSKKDLANQLRNDGLTVVSICKMLHISRRTFYNWNEK